MSTIGGNDKRGRNYATARSNYKRLYSARQFIMFSVIFAVSSAEIRIVAG